MEYLRDNNLLDPLQAGFRRHLSTPTALLKLTEDIRAAKDQKKVTLLLLFVYFPTRKTEIEKLERIQLSSLRTVLGFRSTTPTNIILDEAKISLIRKRAIFLRKAYILKVLSNTNLPVINSINRFFNKTKNNKFKRKRLLQKCIEECYQNHKNKIRSDSHYSIYISDYHTAVRDIAVNTELGSLLKKSKDVNETLSDTIKLSNCIDIFTNGSKIKNALAVGSACVCPKLNIYCKKNITLEASIYTAELIAMDEALNIALSNVNTNYNILSDSLSALLSIKTTKIDSRLNPYILNIKMKYLQFIQKSSQNCLKNFIWVPAHIGIKGNEAADKLAKEATSSEPDEKIRIPHTGFLATLKQSAIINTQKSNIDHRQIKGINYFRSFLKHSSKPWVFNKNLSRKE